MQDQLITIETAKLAKEKGFDIPTLFWYFKNNQAGLDYVLVDYLGEGQFGNIVDPDNHNNPKMKWVLERVSAPTQSLLQRWLREKHNIYLGVNTLIYAGDKEASGFYPTIKNETLSLSHKFLTYEEALEIGLLAGLEHIKHEAKV